MFTLGAESEAVTTDFADHKVLSEAASSAFGLCHVPFDKLLTYLIH